MDAMSQEELDILNQFRDGETLQGWEDFRLEALANRGLLMRGKPIEMNQELRIKCEGGIFIVDTLGLVDLNKRLRAKCAASQTYPSARVAFALVKTLLSPSSILDQYHPSLENDRVGVSEMMAGSC